jgi:hypothetical protein
MLMIDLARVCRRARTEDGGVILLFVMVLSGVLLLSALALDIGNWYEHRRHLQLQTDAAALAGGQFFRECAEPGVSGATVLTDMQGVAAQYGGDTSRVADPFNHQVGGAGTAGNVLPLGFQSSTYPPANTPLVDTDPCSSGIFDVRATEDSITHIFKISPLATVHAHARVEMKAINQLKGLLPLAVPDVRPSYVFVTFVDESKNPPVPIAGCAAGCTEQLVKGATVNNEQTWIPASGTELSVPIVADIGVRVRLVGANDPTLACGQLYTECYDAASANGLVHIRGWATKTAPLAKDVWLLAGSCAPDAYFSLADCSAGVQANVDLGVAKNGNTKVFAQVDGANTKYQLTTSAANGTTGTITWTLLSGVPITGDGPHTITLGYNTGSGADKTFGVVQRAYVGYPGGSGPIDALQVYEAGVSSSGSNSFKVGETHTLGAAIKTIGNLLLSQPNDPAIYLRLFNDSGSASQNQSLDCDKNLKTLADELAQGCEPFFIKNPSLQCPGGNANNLWDIWYVDGNPLPCVLIQTGASVGQINMGLTDRIFGNIKKPSCSDGPINWIKGQGFDEDAHPDDKRALPLIVTPLGTFTGRGGDQVPVIDFGYFYVTGYKDDPCQGTANADAVPNNRGAYVRGHFIKFFPLERVVPSDDKCDLTSITPCVAVLTR